MGDNGPGPDLVLRTVSVRHGSGPRSARRASPEAACAIGQEGTLGVVTEAVLASGPAGVPQRCSPIDPELLRRASGGDPDHELGPFLLDFSSLRGAAKCPRRRRLRPTFYLGVRRTRGSCTAQAREAARIAAPRGRRARRTSSGSTGRDGTRLRTRSPGTSPAFQGDSFLREYWFDLRPRRASARARILSTGRGAQRILRVMASCRRRSRSSPCTPSCSTFVLPEAAGDGDQGRNTMELAVDALVRLLPREWTAAWSTAMAWGRGWPHLAEEMGSRARRPTTGSSSRSNRAASFPTLGRRAP
jgi:hypothetical protein